MPGREASYKQGTKDAVRRKALRHAVELVTKRRDEAAVVPGDHVARVRRALKESAIPGYAEAARACKRSDAASWRRHRERSIGAKTPEEVTVAYLAGPEPSNDLAVLVGLGVRPENIWAFEAEPGVFERALVDLRGSGLRGVKLMATSIENFFSAAPQRFDVIYLDACGPLPSHGQRTTRLLATLFRHGALAPLGVLVTNFARPDTSRPEELDRYAFLAAAYLYPKAFLDDERGGITDGAQAHGFLFDRIPDVDPPEGAGPTFLEKVRENFDHHYGSFITRHITDVAALLAPVARLAGSSLMPLLFSAPLGDAALRGRRFVRFAPGVFDGAENGSSKIGDEDHRVREDDRMDVVEMDGEALMDESAYSLLWTLHACGCLGQDEGEPVAEPVRKFVKRWLGQLYQTSTGSVTIVELVAAYYAWRHDRGLWSPALRRIADYPYRLRMPFLCDAPGPELGFFPAFAQLSYPAHANVREARRYKYTAEGRENAMFLDVLAFDECRYVYDWLSALPLVPDDWDDLSAQLTFRFALDAIAKETRWYADDFLSNCHAIGIDADFPASELRQRQTFRPRARAGSS